MKTSFKFLLFFSFFVFLSFFSTSNLYAQTICEGQTTDLTITQYAQERNIQWFSSTDGTNFAPIAGERNETYNVLSSIPAGVYYYRVKYESRDCTNWYCGWSGRQETFTVTINPTPAAPTTTDNARCGNGTVTLTASGGTNGNYRWYTTATGGTPINGARNATYSPTITATATYYVSIRNASGCESPRTPVTAIISATPIRPASTTGQTRCGPGEVTLTASALPLGTTYRWYTTNTGGTPIAGVTGNAYTTDVTATTTFYVAAFNSCGESTTRRTVTATVNPLPISPGTTGATLTGIGTVILKASGGTNGNYLWYTTATGGTPISGATNSTYSPTITATTTYYVAIRNATTFCESTRTPVTATLNQVPGNSAPTAQNVINTTLITNTDIAKPIDKLSATDVSGGSIYLFTLKTIPAPAQGILLVNDQPARVGQSVLPADQLTFDPELSFFGTAKFTYTATDNQGAVSANTATYYIPVNATPVTSDVTSAITVNGEQNIRPLNAFDLDGIDDIASFTILTLPADGTFTIGPGGTPVVANSAISPTEAKQLYYTPSGWGWFLSQTYTFTYTATDAKGITSNIATYTLPVNGTFGEPSTTPTAENISNNPILNTATVTDIKPLSATGGTIEWYFITKLPDVNSGILYYGNTPIRLTNGDYPIPANGAGNLKFDPEPAFRGNATFTYKASNTENNFSADAFYTIPIHTLSRVDNITTALVLKSAGNTAISDLTAPDPTLIDKYQIKSLPTSGTLFMKGTAVTTSNLNKLYIATNGRYDGLTYTPNQSFGGDYVTFTFIAYNKDGYASNTGTYTIPVTHAPVAIDGITGPVSNTISTSLAPLKATDTEGKIATFTITSLPTSGTLLIGGSPISVSTPYNAIAGQLTGLTYQPIIGYTGDVTFKFTATDHMGVTDQSPATYTIQVRQDTDADGIVDSKDQDDDNDGIPDAVEGSNDKDADGIINSLDLDSDNDGIPDAIEANAGVVPSSTIFSLSLGRYTSAVDANGLITAAGAVKNSVPNTDGDGVPDYLDLDSDDDGILDKIEAQASLVTSNPSSYVAPVNTGGAAAPDYLDMDSDGDGMTDLEEAYDFNDSGESFDDLIKLAKEYLKKAGSSSVYTIPASPTIIPDWLKENIPGTRILNFQTATSAYFKDSDNDGLIDLFDENTFGTDASSKLNNAFRNPGVVTPLPVTLVKFTAQAAKGGVDLNWATATEINNDYFAIEQSQNGRNFEQIGKIRGAGNSNTRINYTYLDAAAPAGTVYYRLKQVDYNGKFEYSNIVAVTLKQVSEQDAKAYPNPFTKDLHVVIPIAEEGIVEIQLHDTYGKIVYSNTRLLQQGTHQISLPLDHLSRSIYILKIIGDNLNQSLKVMKTK